MNEKFIERTKKERDSLEHAIRENDELLEELLQDEKVRKYLEVSKDNDELKTKLSNMLLELACKEIMECKHVFVKTEVVCDRSDRDRVIRKGVYHCLKCGLTNEYEVKEVPKSRLNNLQREMWELYYGNACNGIFVTDQVYSLDRARIVYEGIMSMNPNITSVELKEVFPILYNSTAKSAATIWYEMEQKSIDDAISALDRIRRDNEDKIKVKK